MLHVHCAATSLFQSPRSFAAIIASGMLTSFMSFGATDSHKFCDLPVGIFLCDGVGLQEHILCRRPGLILPQTIEAQALLSHN